MSNSFGWAQKMVMVVGLAALPLAAQMPTDPNRGGTGAPGETATAPAGDANYRDDGFDMGWLGLLGLAGLFGLRRRDPVDRTHTVPSMGTSR